MDRSLSSTGVSSPFSKSSRSFLSSTSRRSSRLGAKLASVHIVTRSLHNVVERFGTAVPVQVEEVFGFSDKNAVITARLAECGYIWVVCGRRLYIWQYQQAIGNASGASKKRLFPHCYELQLPQSDLAHRAALVAVYMKGNANYPCCVAVSPEGMVRYWPDISHDHISVDFHLDLQGQECDSLVDAGSLGCIIVTTTCTVVLVQPKQGNYGPQLTCRTLRTPGTWLGGISKRMSSIFFGPSLGDHGAEAKTIKLLTVPGVMHSYTVYVLAGSNLQKWLLYEQEPEKLEWNTEIDELVKEEFRLQIPNWDLADPSDISAWIVDIQSDRDRILMLTAAANTNLSPKIYFSLISITTKHSNPPSQINHFLLLNIVLRDNNPAEALGYRFILSGINAYVYNAKSITVIRPEDEPDTLDFAEPNDQIFGGAVCLHVPVFFSRQHGLIAVSSADSEMNLSPLESSMAAEVSAIDASYNAPNNLSIYQMDPEEVIAAHKDTLGQLKAAFIFHVTNQLMECNDIVNTLFPGDVPVLAGVDSPLDIVVVKISKNILDDIPAGDPRWTQAQSGFSSPRGLGSSHAMQVLDQLIDKQKAQALFIRFLKDTGLWSRLSAVSIRDSVMATIYVLAELSEKITAATVMKNLPSSGLFEEAIDRAVKNYSTSTGGSLSRQDIFYREVSRVQEGILWLSKVCEESTHSGSSSLTNVAKVVHEANEIIITVAMEVLNARRKNGEIFYLNELAKSMGLEFLPWTTAGGAEGIADALMLQHSVTLNYGIKVIDSGPLRELLIEDFVRLTDILLDGRKTHLATVKSGQKMKVMFKQYCTDRNKLIQPLLDAKCFEQATMLAEKYLHFEALITICDETQNEARLETYMHRFKDTDFSDHVYNWYLKKGKLSKLLNRSRKFEGFTFRHDKLSKFLEAYPKLSWIQQVFDDDFSAAAKTLRNLSENEIDSIATKKSMLSLSKLSRLADGRNKKKTKEQVKEINRNLELIGYQESIPSYVLQQYGYDPRNPKVLPPKDIIALYICPEYSDSTQLEFKKALDVATFIDEEDLHCEMILQIWRAALLRDSWNFHNLDAPLECLQNTLFFSLADLGIKLGSEPATLLPPIDMLIDDSSLKDLTENKDFLFLLKTGYEHFYSTQMI